MFPKELLFPLFTSQISSSGFLASQNKADLEELVQIYNDCHTWHNLRKNLKKIEVVTTRRIIVNDSDLIKIDRLKNFGLAFSTHIERSHEITTDLRPLYYRFSFNYFIVCESPENVQSVENHLLLPSYPQT